MFFDLKLYKKNKTALSLGMNTVDHSDKTEYSDFIKQLLKGAIRNTNGSIDEIRFYKGFTDEVKALIGKSRSSLPCDEEYAISVDTVTKIWAESDRAFIYAISTICALQDSGELYRGFIYDYPQFNVRGYRAYLPSRKGLSDFYKTVDLLSEYKYNSIILEVGGAMEYERHPRINKVWKSFCKDVHRYSGRAHEIQKKTYPWPKNSIHCDNAEGDILTKDECRKIAEYCRSRGLEVIPECPTLSHCDYLVMAYPELRERENDAYPDTYCPNHPDVYNYVFDILEEVIEVFKPSRINIGHDEAYSIGICKRCRSTSAPVLYANDIKKINTFLRSKGIKAIIWGEKLLNARSANGIPIGGAGHGKGDAHVNALFPCRDLIPNDVEILHWYYSFNPDYDKIFHERGFKVYYGNLSALGVKKWDLRRKQGILGGFVSNWGSYGEEYMQRNKQYFSIIVTAYAFWSEKFGKMSRVEKIRKAMHEAYRLKRSKIKHPIKIVHTTDHKIDYKVFYDGVFIEDEKYLLGRYRITYTDGEKTYLDVKYGTNISCKHYDKELTDGGFAEVSYSTLPIRFKDGFAYETVYEDPHPEKAVRSIEYIPQGGKENISVELISFTRDIYSDSRYDGVEATGEDFPWDGARDI